MLDLFSRKVIGWATRQTIHRELVLDAILTAVRQRTPMRTIVHSDSNTTQCQGSQLGHMREAMLGCNQQARRAVVAIHELVGLLGTKRFATESLVLADQLLSVLDVIRREYDTSFEVDLRLDQENLRVQANRTHLRQVLLNLMRNGLEAMVQAKATDPTLTVQVSALTEEGIAEITVADNGPGVRREHRAALFEPFFTTNKRGIGMGLTVSRSLAEANGGKLWLNPKEGPGASFHLTLPLAVVAN